MGPIGDKGVARFKATNMLTGQSLSLVYEGPPRFDVPVVCGFYQPLQSIWPKLKSWIDSIPTSVLCLTGVESHSGLKGADPIGKSVRRRLFGVKKEKAEQRCWGMGNLPSRRAVLDRDGCRIVIVIVIVIRKSP